MKEQIENSIKWLKEQDVDGCITGSVFLEVNPEWNQDVDCFLYSEKAFAKLFYAMYHNPMFTILDPLEIWKANMFMDKQDFSNKNHHTGVQTIKFMYNTCIPINIILKRSCTNIFSVLSSFDMDIISKGYDLKSKEYLDLSGDSQTTKVANFNKWNPAFQSGEIWQISRILRQIVRVVKYYKRGYNTDAVILKYIELIDRIQNFESIFNSENFNEKLKITKENTEIVKQICNLWLESHEIPDEQLQLLEQKLKEI